MERSDLKGLVSRRHAGRCGGARCSPLAAARNARARSPRGRRDKSAFDLIKKVAHPKGLKLFSRKTCLVKSNVMLITGLIPNSLMGTRHGRMTQDDAKHSVHQEIRDREWSLRETLCSKRKKEKKKNTTCAIAGELSSIAPPG